MTFIHRALSAFGIMAVFMAILGEPAAFAQRASIAPIRIDLASDWHYLPFNGEGDFSAPAIDEKSWPAMRLPSNWYLLGSTIYPPQAKADQASLASSPAVLALANKESGFDYSGTVWFRRQIDWNGSGRLPVILDLDMVDYYADVFVNGHPVGHHEGYFQPWSLDVSKQIHPGSNVIAIKISAPALVFDMSQEFPISWPKNQNQLKGIFAYHDTRPGATSRRGQERSTGGIIRGIALRESNGVDLTNITVTPLDVSEASARLVIEATVRNWASRSRQTLLRGEIAPKNFSGDTTLPVTLTINAAPGESRARTEIRIERPALWWSWDYGKPNLYQLKASLTTREGRAARLLDARNVAFGVRSISHDEQWVWRLNGQRIYPRGSNYISTQWLSQADRAWYERDIKMMLEANLNSIRVHAHLERPEFYDVADEMGLMVWQDFPLQWGYTDEPAFHAEALREAEDMIRLYHNHASIIVWCMHNESPHAMNWMQKRDKNQNLALDNALVALAKQLDASRVSHRDSGTGDGHPYPGWYVGKVGDFATYKGESFVTEYGAQALPNLETLRTIFSGDTLWPRTNEDFEVWRYADFQPNETFNIAKVEKGKNIEEFIANSQRYQANLVRFATENFRRRKWNGSTGIYQFMFVEDWPSITWAVVDYYRRPKPGYTALRDSMQPVLPSIAYQVDDPAKPIALYIVNDLHQEFPGATLKWHVTGAGIDTATTQTRAVNIAADSATKIIDLEAMPDVTKGKRRLEVWIEDAGNNVLGRSTLSADDFVKQ